ncbi:MAG: hypothetical protein KGY99_04660 [Phycisphaerae bacterium]|nr:hypothetical protein [Phycisphaerae bacterium]
MIRRTVSISMIVLAASSAAAWARTPADVGATDPADIPAEHYVQVSADGHLELGGQRVRFWGHIGHFPDPKLGQREHPRRDHELMVQRLVDLGFNMHRLWFNAHTEDYEKHDGSRAELRDYGIYLMKQRGIRIWFSCLNNLGLAQEKDVDVLDDPATAEAWKKAIRSMSRTWWWSEGKVGARMHRNLARMWDPRLQALSLERMKAVATHFNKYTGLRYCDDPVMAVWELSNEEWWLRQMLMKGWWQDEEKLADYFRKTLIGQWNAYLRTKYGTDEALKRAWLGLLPGESLSGGTVLFAPIAQPVDVDAQWRVLGVDPAGRADGTVERGDFNAARMADVIDFCLQTVVAQKRREVEALRSWGKSTRLCPVIWDTGFGSEIHSQYLQQFGDAIAHVNYTHGLHDDPTHEHYPFRSGLTEYPQLRWNGISRGEHGKAPGKPYFIYENQIGSTSKYRAEYPMRMAALGSTQDWDIICWHSYGPGPDAAKDRPHVRALEVGTELNLHFGGDEVQLSSMRAASEIFRNCHVAAAPDPTHFIFGRTALYDPESMNTDESYGLMGMRMAPTAYRYGCRVTVDPTLDDRPDAPIFLGEDGKPDVERFERFGREGYLVVGPTVRPRAFKPCPVRPNDQVSYDWRRGNLTFDAPGAAMFTGFYGRLADPESGVSFRNGVTLSDVEVRNPEGMPYPVEPGERYITFALASTDGRPLGECGAAVLSLVSTSFNTGFRLDEANPRPLHGCKVAEPGGLPVLVARVGARIACDAIDGMAYTLRDYEMNVIGQGVVRDGEMRLSADDAVFYVELRRDTDAEE